MLIGYHALREKHTIVEPLMRLKKRITGFGLNPCAQIFIYGPQSYTRTLGEKEIPLVKNLNIPIIVHGAYVDNPWTENSKSIKNIVNEMILAHELGACGLIIHFATSASDHIIANRVIDKIYSVYHETVGSPYESIPLYLEINATKPSSTGPTGNSSVFANPDILNQFFAALHNDNRDIGLCIDTSHLWACGVSMTRADEVSNWFARLKFNGRVMFHLNDNIYEQGSGRDTHAPIGENIWRHDKSGLIEILQEARRRKSLVILERDNPDDAEFALLSRLASN